MSIFSLSSFDSFEEEERKIESGLFRVLNSDVFREKETEAPKECDNGLFAEKFTTSPKKNGAGIKYENKEKEKQLDTHDVLRYV